MKQAHWSYCFVLFMVCAVLSLHGQCVSPMGCPSASPAAKGSVPDTPLKPPVKQSPRRILVIGEADGFEHDSITDAMVAVYNMGHETGLWDATLRTDTELITKKKLERNAKNLDSFDCLVFASTSGELKLSEDQKQDMMKSIHDDGKCFIGIHAALDTNFEWPEYGEMIGGWFDQHPWGTFEAPILNEAPDFPAVRHFPKSFTKRDEIYQAKDWSRSKVKVLLSLDASKLDFSNKPGIHRTDRDFAVAWSKMYGNGRVFYSSLGHTRESWSDPDIRTMYFEAIKWGLKMTEDNGATQAAPASASNHRDGATSVP